jgi:hypothetical protein
VASSTRPHRAVGPVVLGDVHHHVPRVVGAHSLVRAGHGPAGGGISLGGRHFHHYNIGIALLTAIGAIGLRGSDKQRRNPATAGRLRVGHRPGRRRTRPAVGSGRRLLEFRGTQERGCCHRRHRPRRDVLHRAALLAPRQPGPPTGCPVAPVTPGAVRWSAPVGSAPWPSTVIGHRTG